jgi:hypothetical protein
MQLRSIESQNVQRVLVLHPVWMGLGQLRLAFLQSMEWRLWHPDGNKGLTLIICCLSWLLRRPLWPGLHNCLTLAQGSQGACLP